MDDCDVHRTHLQQRPVKEMLMKMKKTTMEKLNANYYFFLTITVHDFLHIFMSEKIIFWVSWNTLWNLFFIKFYYKKKKKMKQDDDE